MGLFDLFRKKSEDELFSEAVKDQDYMTVVKLGKSLLEKNPDNISVLNPYVDALVKLGRKDEAVSTLISFAERKLEEEYYDIAIPILKRVLRIDPLNLKAIKLLVNAFLRKELYYNAFNTLLDSLKKAEESGINLSAIRNLVEEFLKEVYHPVFYEMYGDFLIKNKETENALICFILAGNMYMQLENYIAAWRVFLKARNIKATEIVDKYLLEIILHTNNHKKQSKLLFDILQEHENDLEFIDFTISQLKKFNKLDLIVSNINNLAPKLRYILLTLISYEKGETEEGKKYLNKLQTIDEKLYKQVSVRLKSLGYKHSSWNSQEEASKILDGKLDINQIIDNLIIKEETSHGKIKQEVPSLKNKIPIALLTAEAFMQIGNFETAEKLIQKALDTEFRPRAAVLLSEILKQQKREKDAIAFLIDELKRSDYSEEEKARLKVKLGEIYQSMGERDRALSWYKEAQKVLNDEVLKEKIEELEKETV